MDFTVLTEKDREKWHSYLQEIPDEYKDIYYLPEYFETWKQHEDAEYFCAVAQLGDALILYPFFKKAITEFDLSGGPWFDISSAYGYGGAIAYRADSELIEEFNGQFNAWCKSQNIVAEFIRENPVFNSQIRDATYIDVRNNVYIKLTPDYSISNRHVKKNLNKAARNGLSYKWDPELQHLEHYKHLYNESFKRLEMDPYYLLPDNYYEKIKSVFGQYTGLINIYFEGKIINSLMVFYGFGKFICHLIGTDYNYFEYRPNDLVYKAAIDISKTMDVQLISMGGGITKDDNLFRFKEKFGNEVKDVFIGKKVHNQQLYDELCMKWEKDYPGLAEAKKAFFLKYRLKG